MGFLHGGRADRRVRGAGAGSADDGIEPSSLRELATGGVRARLASFHISPSELMKAGAPAPRRIRTPGPHSLFLCCLRGLIGGLRCYQRLDRDRSPVVVALTVNELPHDFQHPLLAEQNVATAHAPTCGT